MRTGLRTLLISSLFSCAVFASCEKEDSPVILPPAGSAIPATVTMGETYDNEIYFDFETGSVVKISPNNLWDIAFEASSDGYHAYLNGGMDIFAYNTQNTNGYAVNSAAGIASEAFLPDFPGGEGDSTAIGEWCDASKNSKDQVYILKYPDRVFRKITIESVSATEYVISYGDIDDATMKTITIPKESQYSRVYFSFSNGGEVVHPEPAKDNWDIVFTRYHHVYRELENTPYLVSGALLNPYNTAGYDTTTTAFDKIEYSDAIASLPYTTARDVIGWDWKTYNFAAGKFWVNTNHCYLIKNRSNYYYKLRFLDFYDSQGVKGTPSFEYQRIQ